MTEALPSVSVIIPVYDDYARLSNCLHQLAAQTYPAELVEVIVVDNGTPAARVRDVEAEFDQVRWICESEPGSYAARNAGIEASTGHVIAFTDADCLPSIDWIERGVEALTKYPTCGLIGGRISLFAHNQDMMSIAETWEMLDGFPQQKYVEELDFGATANVFTRRAVIEDVGGFDVTFHSGGDREWGERVAAAGYPLIYADEVCVRHPARRSLLALLRKTVRTTRGDFRRQDKHGSWTPLRRTLRLVEAGARLATPIPRAAISFACSEGSPKIRTRYALAQMLVLTTKEWELAMLLLGHNKID